MEEDKQEHFIKNIKIKNFKCFEDFKAEGFGRVNLIGGKNNVGKTAFMEAVYANVHAQDIPSFIQALYEIKYMRENLNLLSIGQSDVDILEYVDLSNNIFTISNKNIAYFKFEENNGTKNYFFDFKTEKVQVNSNQFSITTRIIENIGFIDNFGLCNIDIISNYSFIQKEDEEVYLNQILNFFDERIKSFKIIDEKPQCKISDKYLELIELGDGVRHLISIVTSLYKCENGYLFIDEIDNGIHYTLLDELWKVILDVSDRLNVQVFAVTHSKECIESYARVAKKLEDKETTFIKMTRLDDGSIMAGVRDYDMLQYTMSNGHEVRGV